MQQVVETHPSNKSLFVLENFCKNFVALTNRIKSNQFQFVQLVATCYHYDALVRRVTQCVPTITVIPATSPASLGNFRKYPYYTIDGFSNSEGKGGSLNRKFKGMRGYIVLMIGIPKAWGV